MSKKRARVEIDLLEDDSVSGDVVGFGSFDEEDDGVTSQKAKRSRIDEDSDVDDLDLPTFQVMSASQARDYLPPIDEESVIDNDEDREYLLPLKDRLASNPVPRRTLDNLDLGSSPPFEISS